MIFYLFSRHTLGADFLRQCHRTCGLASRVDAFATVSTNVSEKLLSPTQFTLSKKRCNLHFDDFRTT